MLTKTLIMTLFNFRNRSSNSEMYNSDGVRDDFIQMTSTYFEDDFLRPSTGV